MPFKIGTKQTVRMVEQGKAAYVYVAQDAEQRLKDQIVALCEATGTEIAWAETMKSLGTLCGIDVGAAMAAFVHEDE